MKGSAFEIECKRAELAATGRLKELRKLYSSKYPEIKDGNTANFWDTRYKKRTTLAEQDGMTRNRCQIAASFCPTSKFVKFKILDIGMGDGWLEEILENKNVELCGNDISDVTIKHVKKRFKGEFSVQSIYNMDYKEYFPAVYLLEVLEHVRPSKTFDVLYDILHLLPASGDLIVSVPTNEGLETMPNNPNSHLRMYTVPLICAELKLAGFEVKEVKTLYAFPKYYAFKKFIAFFWRNHWKPNNIIVHAKVGAPPVYG